MRLSVQTSGSLSAAGYRRGWLHFSEKKRWCSSKIFSIFQHNTYLRLAFKVSWRKVNAEVVTGRTGLQMWRSGLVVRCRTCSPSLKTDLSCRPWQLPYVSMCSPFLSQEMNKTYLCMHMNICIECWFNKPTQMGGKYSLDLNLDI